MSISADQTQSWLDQHASTALAGQDIDWLAQLRAVALGQFESVGLPGVRDEQWRYTNLRALKATSFNPSTSLNPSALADALPPATQARLVFIDGQLSMPHSYVADLGEGARLIIFSAALQDDSYELDQHFASTLPETVEQHGFTALNTAYCQNGYVLHLGNNTIVDQTIEVLFIASDIHASDNAAVMHNRNFIVAGANTKCTVVERHIGSDGSVYLNNSVTEIVAGENAYIDHYKILQESNDAFHMGGVFIQQGNHAQVKTHNIALGGLVVRNDVNANLSGQGAHVEMNGLVLGKGRQHIDNHTEVNHAVPNCTSDEYYKTILDDHSRSVFRGRIIVAQDAQLTNADQQNNNLLLSPDAEADSKPQLEIYADDVKCSHGATVGQLDPKALFYLRSRGIDETSANALLTFAFANEVLERIQVESIKQELTQGIAGALVSGLEELV